MHKNTNVEIVKRLKCTEIQPNHFKIHRNTKKYFKMHKIQQIRITDNSIKTDLPPLISAGVLR